MSQPRNIVGTVGQQMDGWQALCNCGWRHRELRSAKRALELLHTHQDEHYAGLSVSWMRRKDRGPSR